MKIDLAGECEEGLQCTPREECPAFQEKESNLEALTSLTTEWYQLVESLEALKCSGEKNWVCCEKGGLENFICIWLAGKVFAACCYIEMAKFACQVTLRDHA